LIYNKLFLPVALYRLSTWGLIIRPKTGGKMASAAPLSN